MTSSFKAADITTSHRSPNAARRHHHSESSTAPSAARLAAEAAFSEVPAQHRSVQPRPLTVEREEVVAPTSAVASVSATPSVEASADSKTPRVFRVSRIALPISAPEAQSTGAAGLEGSAGAVGIGPSNPEADVTPSQQMLRPVRRRRDRHATLSGPVTVLSPPAASTHSAERPTGKSAATTRPEREQQNFVSAPTLNELLESLAAVTATLEELRRTPVWDFQIEPNQEAWLRLSRKADDLLVDIRSARRR